MSTIAAAVRGELLREIAIVSEGLCPRGHGDLTPRPLLVPHKGLSAGWCGLCSRGYAVGRHRHDEECAGPNMDEAHLWCPYQPGEATITWYDRPAFERPPHGGSRWCPGCGADVARGQRCEAWCPTGRQGSGYR